MRVDQRDCFGERSGGELELVRTPGEALACYLKTRMDVLALGNWVLTRPAA